jgi:hypothetical protein
VIETRDAGGGVGLLETPNASTSTRPESAENRLRDRFAGYRHAESRALARVCIAAAYGCALRIPYWMAHSQRDYAVGVLGVKHSSFSRWAKVGRLICARPELHAAFRAGQLTMGALEAPSSRSGLGAATASNATVGAETASSATMGDPTASPATVGAETASSTPGFVGLSISAPAPAIRYIEDSLELARGVAGVSEGDEDAVAALLAEAGTECGDRVDAAVAKARFRVRDQKMGETSSGNGSSSDGALGAGPVGSDADPPALHHPTLPRMGESAQREAALRVHGILQRLIARRDRLRFRLEDHLYDWRMQGLHHRHGFHSFERFAEEILDLPYRSCRERLHRAKLRRIDNPIAIARRDGRISGVQSELLDHLQRECHVPASDLPRWCEYAATHTVRRLRASIRWAKREIDLDYRRWSLSRCAPPDEDQLRTAGRSLEGLVRDPNTHGLSDALRSWQLAPLSTLRLVLTRETRDELLIQMASMQDELRRGAHVRVPAWYALCRIFHRARMTWKEHHQSPPAVLRRILDRDGWQCAAPECTQRKNLQVHHLRYRSRGGDDRDENRITLCAFHHHHGEHGGLMRVRGTLDAHGRGLIWEMGFDGNGRPLRVCQDGRILARTPAR